MGEVPRPLICALSIQMPRRKSHKRSNTKRRARKTQRGGAGVPCGRMMCEAGQICGKDSIGQPQCKTIYNSKNAGKTAGPAGPKAPGAPTKP